MGFFITYLKVQPFIATLAGLWVARGLCFFISDNAIPIRNRLYEVLAGTKLLIPGLADPATKQGEFVSILVVVELRRSCSWRSSSRTTRASAATVYAIGGNELSARLMGLPVNRTKMLVYTLNGLCSALAGIALSIDVGSGHGLYAMGMELTVIGAVVIGGTLLTGGVGLRVRHAVRRPHHRRHPDPDPVQRAAQLLVDADRGRRADARVHRHPELPRHGPEGPPIDPRRAPALRRRRRGADPAARSRREAQPCRRALSLVAALVARRL